MLLKSNDFKRNKKHEIINKVRTNLLIETDDQQKEHEKNSFTKINDKSFKEMRENFSCFLVDLGNHFYNFNSRINKQSTSLDFNGTNKRPTPIKKKIDSLAKEEIQKKNKFLEIISKHDNEKKLQQENFNNFSHINQEINLLSDLNIRKGFKTDRCSNVETNEEIFTLQNYKNYLNRKNCSCQVKDMTKNNIFSNYHLQNNSQINKFGISNNTSYISSVNYITNKTIKGENNVFNVDINTYTSKKMDAFSNDKNHVSPNVISCNIGEDKYLQNQNLNYKRRSSNYYNVPLNAAYKANKKFDNKENDITNTNDNEITNFYGNLKNQEININFISSNLEFINRKYPLISTNNNYRNDKWTKNNIDVFNDMNEENIKYLSQISQNKISEKLKKERKEIQTNNKTNRDENNKYKNHENHENVQISNIGCRFFINDSEENSYTESAKKNNNYRSSGIGLFPAYAAKNNFNTAQLNFQEKPRLSLAQKDLIHEIPTHDFQKFKRNSRPLGFQRKLSVSDKKNIHFEKCVIEKFKNKLDNNSNNNPNNALNDTIDDSKVEFDDSKKIDSEFENIFCNIKLFKCEFKEKQYKNISNNQVILDNAIEEDEEENNFSFCYYDDNKDNSNSKSKSNNLLKSDCSKNKKVHFSNNDNCSNNEFKIKLIENDTDSNKSIFENIEDLNVRDNIKKEINITYSISPKKKVFLLKNNINFEENKNKKYKNIFGKSEINIARISFKYLRCLASKLKILQTKKKI